MVQSHGSLRLLRLAGAGAAYPSLRGVGRVRGGWRAALGALALGLAAAAGALAAGAGGGPGRAVQAMAAADALRGQVIVIDPGHGGQDPGAVGVSGTLEKDVALAVALLVRDLLAAAGARPVLTRSGDYDLSQWAVPGEATPNRAELAARVALVQQHGAAVFVSIHANKHGRRTPWRGAQVFWDPRGHPEGERLARLLQAELRARTGTRRVHLPIEQFVLMRSPVPAATVEVGFLSNPEEERLLQDPAHQRHLAEAVVAGLARFFAGER